MADSGWASLLLEQGYKVYVLDRPGQGRNPFQPFMNGNFDAQAPTFERASRAVGQCATSMIPPSRRCSRRWASRWPTTRRRRTCGARAARSCSTISARRFSCTHGDGAVFAAVVAQDRPRLVKGIVAVEPTANSVQGQLAKVASVPVAIATASDPGIAGIEHIRVAEGSALGMLGHNNREALAPMLVWLNSAVPDSAVNKGAPAGVVDDPHPNRRIDCREAGRSRRVLGRHRAQTDALRDHRAGPDVRAVHDSGGAAPSLSGGDDARRRRPRHAHDGHRRTARLGALLRASRLRRVLDGPAQLRPLALSSRRVGAEPSAQRAALRRAAHQHGRIQHRAVARARRHERSHHRSVHGLRIRQRERRSLPQRSGVARRSGTGGSHRALAFCWTTPSADSSAGAWPTAGPIR